LETSPEFKMPALINGDLFSEGKYFCMAECGLLTFIIPVLITGLVFIGFSKEKIEDEFVKSIREQSLVWATYFAAILLVIFTLTIYSWSYLYAIYSIFPLFLIAFIIKFRVELYKANKGGAQ
jgi:cell division protein FtsW (lipid II flippase)